MDEEPIIGAINDQVSQEAETRPCHNVLRIFAIWQPRNANRPMKLYNVFGYLLNLALMGSVVYLLIVSPDGESGENFWSKWGNSVTTWCTLGFPFFYIKYFYHKVNYDLTMARMKDQNIELFIKCMKVAKLYYLAWFFIFLVASTQILLAMTSIYNHEIDLPVIVLYLAFVYGTGCWSCWLVTYCFECHVNYLEIRYFQTTLLRLVEEDNSNKINLDRCLATFRILKRKLDMSRDNLHILLSVAITLRLVDMMIYSIAFFSNNFPTSHTIWIYLFTISVTSLAIFIKLFPAALISSELSTLVEAVGDLCLPKPDKKADRDAIVLHQYLNTCTQSMGYRILSVRITMQLATTILISFTSLLLTFIKLLGVKS